MESTSSELLVVWAVAIVVIVVDVCCFVVGIWMNGWMGEFVSLQRGYEIV
jgi:hypothetical protein